MNQRSGLSLIEVLVAVAIGAILVVGSLTIIVPTLKSHRDVTNSQIASGLGKELLDNARVFGEGSWHNVDSLATTSANKYYLSTANSPYSAVAGIESVSVSTSTYSRYFYLTDVYRNGSGKIDTSGTTLDPSVKKITVWYAANYNSSTVSGTLISYLARSMDNVFTQTDWSAGGNQDGPLTATGTNSKFASSSNINYTTSTGSIVIQGF